MIPSGGDVGVTTAWPDDIQKATDILKRPKQDAVICIGSFRMYAYDNIGNIVDIAKIYIPVRLQPCDLKIETPVAPSRLHSESVCLRIVSLVLSTVLR